jgi:hypothetical protein
VGISADTFEPGGGVISSASEKEQALRKISAMNGTSERKNELINFMAER